MMPKFNVGQIVLTGDGMKAEILKTPSDNTMGWRSQYIVLILGESPKVRFFFEAELSKLPEQISFVETINYLNMMADAGVIHGLFRNNLVAALRAGKAMAADLEGCDWDSKKAWNAIFSKKEHLSGCSACDGEGCSDCEP